MQSLDTSRRSPPVLLELKVDLRTQRGRDLFDRVTQFCREAVGDSATLGYLEADRWAVLLPRSDSDQVERLIEQLRAWGVEVRRLRMDATAVAAQLSTPSGWLGAVASALKRWGERAAAAVGLVLAAPLLLILALTVKISKPGPVLTVHDRPGRDGRRCRVYRFRAQSAPAKAKRPTWIHGISDARRRRDGGSPRTLSVDRLLTETRLHRLPQLWNVVRGELPLRSLTGSRTARARPPAHPGFSAPNRS